MRRRDEHPTAPGAVTAAVDRDSYPVLHRAHRAMVSFAKAAGTEKIETLRDLRGFAISSHQRVGAEFAERQPHRAQE